MGSPTASPLSVSNSASEQSDIPSASKFSSSEKCSTTVILFWVRVPVLSEQMICVQPSVSTAVSLRMIALRFDMLVTPIDSTIVTTVASPSGIAATASDTAIINVLRMVLAVSDFNVPSTPARMSDTANITTQMPSTR